MVSGVGVAYRASRTESLKTAYRRGESGHPCAADGEALRSRVPHFDTAAGSCVHPVDGSKRLPRHTLLEQAVQWQVVWHGVARVLGVKEADKRGLARRMAALGDFTDVMQRI